MQAVLRIRTFWHDRRLESASARARRAGLARQGAFVRQKAKTRLRRRKRPSRPGESPSIHTAAGEAGLGAILFAVDADATHVLIGPRRFNAAHQDWITGASTTVPQTLEHGGVVTIHEEGLASGRPWHGGEMWRRRDRRRGTKDWKRYRQQRATYAPRPFMGPAAEASAPELAAKQEGTFI